jgi:hypothetical protein
MARLDTFNANSRPEPPDRQLAQVEQRVGRSEGNAVIAADFERQTALLKKPLKHDKSIVLLGGGKNLAAQKKTACRIGDGQRVAVLMIPQQELALVIGAPQFMRSLA